MQPRPRPRPSRASARALCAWAARMSRGPLYTWPPRLAPGLRALRLGRAHEPRPALHMAAPPCAWAARFAHKLIASFWLGRAVRRIPAAGERHQAAVRLVRGAAFLSARE